jgi:hypothetical protein
MARFNVRISGLERAKVIPSDIEARLARLRLELIPPLVADFIRTEPPGGKWPKGRRGTIQSQTKGVLRGDTILIGTFHSRFARHLDTGGTVRPRKPNGVIRFRNQEGEFVFTRKPVTHAPRPYFARVLTQVPEIVSLVYDRVMSGVGR